MKRIPFVPFPVDKAVKMSRPFIGMANRLIKFFPSLNTSLNQGDMGLTDREYLSITIFSAIFWFIILNVLFLPIALVKNPSIVKIVVVSSGAISLLSFYYITLYPRLLVVKKSKIIGKDLLFALRHLLIQIKSGVTLFEGMISISRGDYGAVSEEFAKCTKDIATGMSEIDAIDNMALRNPHIYFRRILWQLGNAMRAGTDVGNALGVLVDNLSSDQKIEIREYGSQLNPLALMYMMFTVVMPSLGITFLFIISSFSGFSIPNIIFYIILISLAIFQFMFLGLIKSRRPAIEL